MMNSQEDLIRSNQMDKNSSNNDKQEKQDNENWHQNYDFYNPTLDFILYVLF